MKLTIIQRDRESEIACITYSPEATKHMYCTLRPICLAHEIGHVRLGHITMKEVSWRNHSCDNLLLQELECWRYVFSLHEWDTEDMQFTHSCLDETIEAYRIETVKVLAIYQEFKVAYHLEVDLT